MSGKISVVIIVYNQADKIRRCLDSLLRSNFKDFEVVVADDCSTDTTREVVRQWMSDNSTVFKSILLVENETNVGVVSNIVKGINASHGVFVKLIAGDDWFCDGAFDFYNDIIVNRSFDIAFCPVRIALENQFGEVEITDCRMEASKKQSFFSLSSKDQFNALALSDLLPAPGSFFTRAYWDSIQLERYNFKIGEDWPMWILGTLKELKFIKIEEPLVVYLRHKASITQNIASPLYKVGINDTLKMFKMIILPNKSRLYLKTLARVWVNYFALTVLRFLPNGIVKCILESRRRFKSFSVR